MEKLIELLNEYEAKRHKTSVVAEIRKQKEDRLSYLEMNWNYSELLCISKGYEFIKRLIDDDKIDRHNVGYSTMLGQLSDYHGLNGEQELLMLLAIQENPIEFLVSILR